MDYTLQSAFNECDWYIRQLLDRQQKALDDIPNCVGGEILSAYREVSDQAVNRTQMLRKELQQLQEELTEFAQLRKLGM